LIQFILVITVITIITVIMAIYARMANTLFPDVYMLFGMAGPCTRKRLESLLQKDSAIFAQR
jgi:hypothetical protein